MKIHGDFACHPDQIVDFSVLPDDELYQATRTTMLRAFGYADDYPPYQIAYPWILKRLRGLRSGARLLDLGAGVNPLPLILAEGGAWVDCVDSSTIRRTLPATEKWNGWGFFDYSCLHPNLTSYQCAAEDFRATNHYHAIYSAGMISHLRATARATVLARCRSALDQGAPLLIYLDLIPGTDSIWNHCAGKVVEEQATHGTVQTILHELETAGFDLVDCEVFRRQEGTRTDIFMIHCASACSGNVKSLECNSEHVQSLFFDPC